MFLTDNHYLFTNVFHNFFYRCFMERSLVLYVGVILPIALSLFINIIVLCLIMKSLNKRSDLQRNKSKANIQRNNSRSEIFQRIRIILILSLIFSLTWISGIPIMFSDHPFFQYAFCAANTLQGSYIFIVYCVRNEQVVKAWKMFFAGKNVRQIHIALKLTSSKS